MQNRTTTVFALVAMMLLAMLVVAVSAADMYLPSLDEVSEDVRMYDEEEEYEDYNTKFEFDTVNVPSEMYFTIGSGEIREMPADEGDREYAATIASIYKSMPHLNFQANEVETMSASGVNWALVINTAKEAWAFIEKNQPVSDVQTSFANALPGGVSSAYELERWKAPVVRNFQILYKNGFGVEVVDLQFAATFVPGGQYNGKGQYLDRIGMIPKKVSVLWGYTLNANINIPSLVNTGTTADPVAAAQIELRYTVSTVVKKETASVTYYATGNGHIQRL